MWHRLAVSLIALLMMSSVVHCSEWSVRPGTISHAKTLADGSHVCLDAVVVEKINAQGNPANFVIREWFDSVSTLVVLTQPSPDLRLRQSVDIEGVISTLPDGRRVITDASVLGYTDRDGNLLRWRMKGLLEPYPWQWKVDLTVSGESPMMRSESFPSAPLLDSPTGLELCQTIADAKAVSDGTAVELRCKPIASIGSGFFIMGEDGSQDTLKVYYTRMLSTSDRVRSVLGTVQTEGSDRVLNVDSGPGYDPQVFQGSIQTAVAGSIAWAKTWPDGHAFTSGDLTGKIITRDWTDHFYIEENDRSCGIRVEKTNHGRHRDQRVDVLGTLSTNADQERYIAATTVTLNGSGTLKPIGIGNKSLGGDDYAYLPGPPVSGQRGITDAYGVNNIGLLVTIWGKVTEVDPGSPPQWFRVDDGSVIVPKIAYPPYGISLDDYVLVSGISSCEYDAQNDLLNPVLCPQPVTATINQASGQSDPTNTSPVNFTVTFSESVSGFSADDVAVSGTAGGTKTITITPTDTAGQVYSVAVTGMTAGTVIASIPFGRARSSSGGWNYASTSTDNSVLYDNVAPAAPSSAFLNLVVRSTGRIHTKWAGSVSPDVVGYSYKIERKATDGSWQLFDGPYLTSGIEAIRSGLALTAAYFRVKVKARDAAGNESSETLSNESYGDNARTIFLWHVSTRGYTVIPGCLTNASTFLQDVYTTFSYEMSYTNPSSAQWTTTASVPEILNVLNQYNTVIIAFPYNALTPNELTAFYLFVNGGGDITAFQKRVILIGDYMPFSTVQNGRLNGILAALGTVIRFAATNSLQDLNTDYDRWQDVCSVNGSHYLNVGVNGLWDDETGYFSTQAQALAYTHDAPSAVMATADGTAIAGSIVAIHDADILNPIYSPRSTNNPNHYLESASSKNGRFIRNICVVY